LQKLKIFNTEEIRTRTNNTMKTIIAAAILFCTNTAFAQTDINALLNKAKAKIETVNDYEAAGVMKTNVAFLKVPIANVKVYFKKPNKLKVKSERGISFIPKGAVSINLNNLTGSNQFTVIDAGVDKINAVTVRVAKLLPLDDNSDIVLSTVYIDEATSLILKAKTTTKDNGTYELDMTYAKYAAFGLPDKIIFSFNAKDYKLPKGVTFDFDDGAAPAPVTKDPLKGKKGRAEITFKNYVINKGVADAIFSSK
jgi:outer membrane lipoprotein-sorting protein